MSNKIYLIFCFVLIAMFSCSKKNHPAASTILVSKDSTIISKSIVKRKLKEPVPKVISVSDSGAHKTIDGKYYYDLDGHRYWKNFKDGKYYIFNKSMYQNNDFKPVSN